VPPARVRLTAAKSSLRRHRNLRLTRPQGSDFTSTSDYGLRLARPLGSDSTSTSEDGLRLARPRARTKPRPRTTVSASPDPRARTQPRLRKTVSASPDPGLGLNLVLGRRSPPRPTLGLGLNLDLGGVTTSLGPTTPQGGAIITLPLASPGYGGQDRRPIWLAPVKQVMMAPRVLHDNGGSQPLTEARRRQQGSDSPDSCASTGLKRSSDGHDAT
jgi:hypothetical protein